MFGAIFLVFGLLLWLWLNHGASSGSVTTNVTTPQPSDAAIAAGVQLQTAQLDAQSGIAMGQLSLAANADNNQTQKDLGALALEGQLAQIQADSNAANTSTEASLAALSLQLGHDLSITHDNNQFMLDYAKNAQDAATQQLIVGANLQEALSTDQLRAFSIQTLASQIPNLRLHGGQRLQAFDLLTASVAGQDISIGGQNPVATGTGAVAPATSGGGGFNPLSAIGGVVGVVAGAVL